MRGERENRGPLSYRPPPHIEYRGAKLRPGKEPKNPVPSRTHWAGRLGFLYFWVDSQVVFGIPFSGTLWAGRCVFLFVFEFTWCFWNSLSGNPWAGRLCFFVFWGNSRVVFGIPFLGPLGLADYVLCFLENEQGFLGISFLGPFGLADYVFCFWEFTCFVWNYFSNSFKNL